MMNCKELKEVKSVKCGNIPFPRREYTFKNGKCFCDGVLIGVIKSIEGHQVTVEHKNGSFSDGIRVFILDGKAIEKALS